MVFLEVDEGQCACMVGKYGVLRVYRARIVEDK